MSNPLQESSNVSSCFSKLTALKTYMSQSGEPTSNGQISLHSATPPSPLIIKSLIHIEITHKPSNIKYLCSLNINNYGPISNSTTNDKLWGQYNKLPQLLKHICGKVHITNDGVDALINYLKTTLGRCSWRFSKRWQLCPRLDPYYQQLKSFVRPKHIHIQTGAVDGYYRDLLSSLGEIQKPNSNHHNGIQLFTITVGHRHNHSHARWQMWKEHISQTATPLQTQCGFISWIWHCHKKSESTGTLGKTTPRQWKEMGHPT